MNLVFYFYLVWFFILLGFLLYIIFVVYPQSRIKDLCLASSQWSNASIEDRDPLSKVIHASFGLAFFNAALHLSNEKEILKITGIESKEFTATLKTNLKDSLNSVRELHEKKT